MSDSVDYVTLLRRIDPGVRKALYTKLLKGTIDPAGRPVMGLEERFVQQVSQMRVFEANLNVINQRILESKPADGEQPSNAYQSLVNEGAEIAASYANIAAGLDALSTELKKVQDDLEAIADAGI